MAVNYPTKQQVESLKEWEELIVELIEECILCWYKEYWWMLCIKVPEMTAFCLKCVDKFEDNNSKWRWTYQIWNWFIINTAIIAN